MIKSYYRYTRCFVRARTTSYEDPAVLRDENLVKLEV